MQGEWRQRLENGSYTIRAAGIYQLDHSYFVRDDGTPTPGYRDWRGSIESTGKFALSPMWTCGWDAVAVTDPTFFQNYRIRSLQQRTPDPFGYGLTEGVSQLYLNGRGDRSYFDIRAIHYTGFSEADVQSALPEHSSGAGLFANARNAGIRRRSRLQRQFDEPVARSRQISIRSAVRGHATCRAHRDGGPGRQNSHQLPAARHSRRLHAPVGRSALAPPDHRLLRPGLDAVRVGARATSRTSTSATEPGVSNFITPGESDSHPRHADGRPRVSLSRSSACSPGAPRRSSRSPGHRASERAATSASCRTKTRKASSTTTPICSRSTSSPAGTAPKAAAAPTPACNTPPNSIAAASSTCCSASPTSCSATTRSRWAT